MIPNPSLECCAEYNANSSLIQDVTCSLVSGDWIFSSVFRIGVSKFEVSEGSETYHLSLQSGVSVIPVIGDSQPTLSWSYSQAHAFKWGACRPVTLASNTLSIQSWSLCQERLVARCQHSDMEKTSLWPASKWSLCSGHIRYWLLHFRQQ